VKVYRIRDRRVAQTSEATPGSQKIYVASENMNITKPNLITRRLRSAEGHKLYRKRLARNGGGESDVPSSSKCKWKGMFISAPPHDMAF